MSRSNEIADAVVRTLDQYFRDLDGEKPAAIHDMVIRNVERPMLQFVRDAGIDRAGCFAYSPVDGAAANALPGQLPAELRERRRARFMAVAEQVSAERLQRRVGATMQVLVDQAPALGRRGGVGRSYADAPEIDGTVRLLPPVKASTQLRVGEFARVRIVAAEGHDLVGQPL